MEQNTMAVREQQWLETIQTAKKSGLPVNQWCHENGIAESTFYRWQQRIRRKSSKKSFRNNMAFR